MSRIQIRDGVMFSLFYVFVKGVGKLTDEALLKALGVKQFKVFADKDVVYGANSLFITEDSEWIHLMDSWGDLYFSEEGKNGIQKLSKQFDIFTCAVGDADESFQFRYFVDGQLIREYVVEDSNYNGGQVKINYGDKLINEETALMFEDQFDKVLEIAIGIGIELEHSEENIRHYKYLKKG